MLIYKIFENILNVIDPSSPYDEVSYADISEIIL